MARKTVPWSGIGIQPAQLQIRPKVRSADSRIQPPSLTTSVAARIGLLEELRRAQRRILELEAELERSRPPF